MQNIQSSRWQILHPAGVPHGHGVIGFSIGMAPRWGAGGVMAIVVGTGHALSLHGPTKPPNYTTTPTNAC